MLKSRKERRQIYKDGTRTRFYSSYSYLFHEVRLRRSCSTAELLISIDVISRNCQSWKHQWIATCPEGKLSWKDIHHTAVSVNDSVKQNCYFSRQQEITEWRAWPERIPIITLRTADKQRRILGTNGRNGRTRLG